MTGSVIYILRSSLISLPAGHLSLQPPSLSMRQLILLAPESGLLAQRGIPIDDFVIVTQVKFNYIFDISSKMHTSGVRSSFT